MESDTYDETFESSGVGIASPPPDFLVAFGVDEQYISKHAFTWEDTSDPTNQRHLNALEEALSDFEETVTSTA